MPSDITYVIHIPGKLYGLSYINDKKQVVRILLVAPGFHEIKPFKTQYSRKVMIEIISHVDHVGVKGQLIRLGLQIEITPGEMFVIENFGNEPVILKMTSS